MASVFVATTMIVMSGSEQSIKRLEGFPGEYELGLESRQAGSEWPNSSARTGWATELNVKNEKLFLKA
jgi:hypothetical protein